MDLGSQPVGAAGSPGLLGVADGGRSSRRRRPSGRPPPLPHHLQATGIGWLIGFVLAVALSLVIFTGELRGPAVAVTVVDDAVVRWLAGLRRSRPVGDDEGAGGAGFVAGDHGACCGVCCWR